MSEDEIELVEVDSDEPARYSQDEPPPPPARPAGPLRVFDKYRIPESVNEIVARALKLGGLSPVLLVYLPVACVPLFIKRAPWVDTPLAWPGQAGCTFVITFALLERARTVFLDESNVDPIAIPGLLLKVLVFFFPVMLGVGSMPWTAWLVIPPLVLALPVILGAFATEVWGELTPPGLWNAWRVTPNYAATVLLNTLVLGLGMGAVWAFPDGPALPRAVAGLFAAGFCGALAGSARRDAELGEV